ncbi:hypothetical protein MPSEU_001072300 [Mayamaea pseudoterrestris]|nr:hypothetical protein MPSEU_001072300 [Mayamaea pseudoterrestris]
MPAIVNHENCSCRQGKCQEEDWLCYSCSYRKGIQRKLSQRKRNRGTFPLSRLLVASVNAFLLFQSDRIHCAFAASEGTPVREVPPEIDVSPAPTPAYSTRRPTSLAPTAPPSFSPTTDAPTTTPTLAEQPATASPTNPKTSATNEPTVAATEMETTEPTVSQTAISSSSSNNTSSNTSEPTVNATVETEQPSPKPTRIPTRVPTTRKPATRKPSLQPTKAPVSKKPTVSPTPQLKKTLSPISYTQKPIMTTPAVDESNLSSFPASIPINFAATVQAPTYETPQRLAANCERIWETYMAARLRAIYRTNAEIQPSDVKLVVSLDGNSQQRRRKLRRRYDLRAFNATPAASATGNYLSALLISRNLRTTQRLDLKAIGSAGFFVNRSSMTDDEFMLSAQNIMDTIHTQESLQQALTLGGTDTIVISVTTSMNTTNDSSNYSDTKRPSTGRITAGFILLFLTLASLLFWVRLLYTKRQKERKRKRLAELRQSQSKLARLPPQMHGIIGKARGVPPPSVASSLYPAMDPLPTTNEEDDSSSNSSNYPGLDSFSEPMDNIENDIDSDPFARELQDAVSLDQMAWREILRQKEHMDMASRELVSPAPWARNGNKERSTSSQQRPRPSAGVYAGREGQEPIQRINSFPYGDENDPGTSFQHHDGVEVSINEAVRWDADGVLLQVTPRGEGENCMEEEDDGNFEPYGDEQSLDPQRSGRRILSNYSFAYPLAQQKLTAEHAQNGDQQQTEGTETYEPYQLRDFDDLLNELSSDDSDNDVDPGDMLEEVARLSDYVKRYGQKKEFEKSVREEMATSYTVSELPPPNPLLERLETSRSSPRRSTNSFSPSRNSSIDVLSTKYSKISLFQQAAAFMRRDRSVDPRAASMNEDKSENDNIVEDIGRLGIGRFDVQRPSNHLLSLRTGEDKAEIRQFASVTPDDSGESDAEHGVTPTSTASGPPGPDEDIGLTPPRATKHAVQFPASMSNMEAAKPSAGIEMAEQLVSKSVRKSQSPARNRSASAAFENFTSGQTLVAAKSPTRNYASYRSSSPNLAPVKGLAAVPTTSKNSRSAMDVSPTMVSSLPPQQLPRPIGFKRPAQVSPRSKNSNFNHIISLFENKPKNAVQPLSENWQHNGASPVNNSSN